MSPEDLAERLRDIRDIDPVSAWPPGPGWWLIAVLGIALVIVLVRFRPRLRIPTRHKDLSWQRSAARELRRLSQRVQNENPKHIADDLAELLRRIAIARCGRDTCAGLVGDTWLSWLRDNDPDGFDWSQHGRILAFSAYAPSLPAEASTQLGKLIEAARAWTKSHQVGCTSRSVAADV